MSFQNPSMFVIFIIFPNMCSYVWSVWIKWPNIPPVCVLNDFIAFNIVILNVELVPIGNELLGIIRPYTLHMFLECIRCSFLNFGGGKMPTFGFYFDLIWFILQIYFIFSTFFSHISNAIELNLIIFFIAVKWIVTLSKEFKKG